MRAREAAAFVTEFYYDKKGQLKSRRVLKSKVGKNLPEGASNEPSK